MPAPTDPKVVKEIVRAYKRGDPVTEIAVKAGIHIPTIYDILKREKVGQRTGRMTQAQKDEVVRLYVEENWGSDRIAKTLDRTPQGIRYVLKMAGIERVKGRVLSLLKTPEEERRFLAFFDAHGAKETAQEYGISENGAYKIQKRVRG